MNLIRKYKISKLLNQPLIGVENEIVLFIQEWLKDLVPFKHSEYPNSTFYMKVDGRYVLEDNLVFDNLWVRYIDFWRILEEKYSMSKIEISTILKFIIEEKFKQQVKPPMYKRSIVREVVEEAFKEKNNL